MSGKFSNRKKDAPPANVPAQYAGLWNNPGAVVVSKTVDPRSGDTITRTADGQVHRTPPEKPGRSQSEKDKASAANRAASQSDAVATADAAQGYVWVNGQRMRVTGKDSQGGLILSYEQPNGTQAKAPTQNGTVFNALNLSDIPNGAAPFLMSANGVQRDADGNEVGSYQNVSRMGRGDMSVGPTGRNMMTIENGLQWFANLSTKDPKAYQQMTKELQEAGYLPHSGATGTSQFGADAAHAMALAMRDLAVVNNTAGGYNTDLETFLTSAKATTQADVKAKAEAAYQPVNREYQDPATLAAQAKQAAQDALGRALTPDEEKKFEASFRGKENSMYDAADASGRAQAGASAIGQSAAGASFYRPDSSGEAQAFVDSPEFEQEKAGVAIGKYADVLKQMVGL